MTYLVLPGGGSTACAGDTSTTQTSGPRAGSPVLECHSASTAECASPPEKFWRASLSASRSVTVARALSCGARVSEMPKSIRMESGTVGEWTGTSPSARSSELRQNVVPTTSSGMQVGGAGCVSSAAEETVAALTTVSNTAPAARPMLLLPQDGHFQNLAPHPLSGMDNSLSTHASRQMLAPGDCPLRGNRQSCHAPSGRTRWNPHPAVSSSSTPGSP